MDVRACGHQEKVKDGGAGSGRELAYLMDPRPVQAFHIVIVSHSSGHARWEKGKLLIWF